MTSEQPGAPEHRVEISMPDDVVPGVYADLVGVWHTPEVFVLDFSTFVEPARLVETAGAPSVVQHARVVARVRVPPGQVFEIMRALEQQLTAWESETQRSSG
jgi:hypothetical protein